MEKLISTLALTYRHQSMTFTAEAKSSEGKAAESELYVLVISVDNSKKEEKTLIPSSALAEVASNSKEDKQVSCDGEKVKHEEVKKDVSECMFPVHDKKVTVHKGGEIQISCHAKDVESKKSLWKKMFQLKG